MCISGLYLIPLIVLKDTANIFDAGITDHMHEMLVTISFGLLLNENTDWGILLLVVLLIPLLTRPKALFIAMLGISGILYILGYKFVGGVRHCGVLLDVVFVSYALSLFYTDDKYNIKIGPAKLLEYGSWALAAVTLLQLQYTTASYGDDVTRNYSDSKEVADVIKLNNLTDATIIAYPAAYACTVLPYLGANKKFYYPESHQFKSYYINDSFYRRTLTDDDIMSCANDSFRNTKGNLLVLSNYPLRQDLMKNYDLIYYSTETAILKQEMFCLYKRKQ